MLHYMYSPLAPFIYQKPGIVHAVLYNFDDDPDIPHLKDPPKKRPYNPFADGLLDGLKGLFSTAGQDPIVLDLNGNGVKTLGQDAGVFFDHDGNGFAQLFGWVASDDGLLAH